jgi:methyl-accepting chemotaxis protein
MMLHNKNNEEVLRTRLKEFTEKIRKIEKKVEETSSSMSS